MPPACLPSPLQAQLQRPPPPKRDPYYRGGGPRPLLRGRLMRLLLPYWSVAAVSHMLYCDLVLEPNPDSERSLLRFLVAAATSLNVLFSDRFHNSDTHTVSRPLKERRAFEVFWLRLDFTGISFVLSSTFALWSCHFRRIVPFRALTFVGFAATGLVGCAAFALFDRGASSQRGEAVIKAALGVQYVLLFGYMVYTALGTPCAPHTLIWFTYLPGFVAYTIKRPTDGSSWGAHDVFHVFVLLGHVMSAACDAINVTWDCASAV